MDDKTNWNEQRRQGNTNSRGDSSSITSHQDGAESPPPQQRQIKYQLAIRTDTSPQQVPSESNSNVTAQSPGESSEYHSARTVTVQTQAPSSERTLADFVAATEKWNSDKDRLLPLLKRYQATEGNRRHSFKQNGFTLSKEDALPWILKDLYLHSKAREVMPTGVRERFKNLYKYWSDRRNTDEEGFHRIVPMLETMADNQDSVVQQDSQYLESVYKSFENFHAFLEERVLDCIFDGQLAHEIIPPIFEYPGGFPPTLDNYLSTHTVRRYSSATNQDKLEANDLQLILAYKREPWSGMSMVEASCFFKKKAASYWKHDNRRSNPEIARIADVFLFLSSFPSPVLAFDAARCFDHAGVEESDVYYIETVMGDDEVPQSPLSKKEEHSKGVESADNLQGIPLVMDEPEDEPRPSAKAAESHAIAREGTSSYGQQFISADSSSQDNWCYLDEESKAELEKKQSKELDEQAEVESDGREGEQDEE